MEELSSLQVNIKKVEGTKHDYKLITTLDASPNVVINGLSEKAQESIDRMSAEYVKAIIEVIRIDRNTEKGIRDIKVKDLLQNFKDIQSKGIVSRLRKENVLNMDGELKLRRLEGGFYHVEDKDGKLLGKVMKK